MKLADHSTEAAHRLYDHSKVVELRRYVAELQLYPERRTYKSYFHST